MKTPPDNILNASTIEEWRDWLEKNSQSGKFVSLVIYHKGSKTQGMDIASAMEQALCFGWIDSVANKRDHESFFLKFSPRNPKSTWSKVNKDRAERMIREGLMRPPGQAMIDLAKTTGTWDKLENVDREIIPDDLQLLFNKNKTAFQNFMAFPSSSKRLILGWIEKAKRPETREKRIGETVRLAKENIRANHPS